MKILMSAILILPLLGCNNTKAQNIVEPAYGPNPFDAYSVTVTFNVNSDTTPSILAINHSLSADKPISRNVGWPHGSEQIRLEGNSIADYEFTGATYVDRDLKIELVVLGADYCSAEFPSPFAEVKDKEDISLVFDINGEDDCSLEIVQK